MRPSERAKIGSVWTKLVATVRVINYNMSQSKVKKTEEIQAPVYDHQQPQATVTEISTTLKVIKEAREIDAGLNGHLWCGDRQILVTRGGDSTQSAFQVYNRFSVELDLSGQPFKYSVKFRGISHIDPVWHLPVNVNGERMAKYLSDWFIPTQLVSNASAGQALLLLDEFPKLYVAQLLQPRYSGLFRDLFTSLD